MRGLQSRDYRFILDCILAKLVSNLETICSAVFSSIIFRFQSHNLCLYLTSYRHLNYFKLFVLYEAGLREIC